jgi:uncharacterized protein (TIGR00251 family)
MLKPDPSGTGVLIAIKAVPGARRDEIVGRLGDRLKVRVSAPPEGGKANRAIRALLAAELNLREQDVQVVRGQSSPEKTVLVLGVRQADLAARWA